MIKDCPSASGSKSLRKLSRCSDEERRMESRSCGEGQDLLERAGVSPGDARGAVQTLVAHEQFLRVVAVLHDVDREAILRCAARGSGAISSNAALLHMRH